MSDPNAALLGKVVGSWAVQGFIKFLLGRKKAPETPTGTAVARLQVPASRGLARLASENEAKCMRGRKEDERSDASAQASGES